jgi:hypothetical protein
MAPHTPHPHRPTDRRLHTRPRPRPTRRHRPHHRPQPAQRTTPRLHQVRPASLPRRIATHRPHPTPTSPPRANLTQRQRLTPPQSPAAAVSQILDTCVPSRRCKCPRSSPWAAARSVARHHRIEPAGPLRGHHAEHDAHRRRHAERERHRPASTFRSVHPKRSDRRPPPWLVR